MIGKCKSILSLFNKLMYQISTIAVYKLKINNLAADNL